MKKIYYYIMLAVGVLALSSCSTDEDTTPSHVDVNKFAPADDDNSAEAAIRRDFKEKTNSYLIFNDTLSKERIGEDMYGNPVYKVETLDIGYEMVGYGNSYIYTYDYIESDAEKQKAAKFIEDNLAKKLGGMMPFSVLLANGVHVWIRNENGELEPAEDSYDHIVPNPDFVLGSRCWAFNMKDGTAYDDETFFTSMLEDIVYTKLMENGKAYTQEFCDVIENYDKYDYYDKEELGYEVKKDDDVARSIGFVKDYGRWYFSKDREWDTRQYLKYLLFDPYEDIEAEFARYPICLKRFSILRDKIKALGYDFDA